MTLEVILFLLCVLIFLLSLVNRSSINDLARGVQINHERIGLLGKILNNQTKLLDSLYGGQKSLREGLTYLGMLTGHLDKEKGLEELSNDQAD
jgi:hypothetical protein